jgi:NADP-dependent 3-hydroxy acid dehydrogenase YdfG
VLFAVAVKNYFDVSGARALVTGSTRGIGLALAGALVQAGCATVIHGRDQETLDRVRDRMLAESPHAKVHTGRFDITDQAAVAAGVAGIEAAPYAAAKGSPAADYVNGQIVDGGMLAVI